MVLVLFEDDSWLNLLNTSMSTSILAIDGFHSIFSLWQLEGKESCDVDIDQSSDSMVM